MTNSAATQAIQQLYVAYFKRPADAAGLAYWEDIVTHAGGSTVAVSAAFADSAEYKASFANMNANAVVTTVYQNLFGRAAETAGLAYWAPLLDSGAVGIDTIVKQVADGAQASDRTSLANKVAAAMAFTNALDTAAEREAYANPAGAPAAKAFIAAIVSDASLAAALVPAAMDASVAAVLRLAQSRVLNGGADAQQAGPAGTDYQAPSPQVAPTLQSGDRLTGMAGQADSLRAELATQAAAVRPELADIDQVVLRALGGGGDAAHLDARDIRGTTRYIIEGSSADLTIDNIMLPALVPHDIVIELRSSAPGDVDLGVYFDHAGLFTPPPASAPAMQLQLLQTLPAMDGAPLAGSPITGVKFLFNGKLVSLESKAILAAPDYPQLVLALREALAAVPGMEGVSVTLGNHFFITNGNHEFFNGTEVVLTGSGKDVFSVAAPGAGWTYAFIPGARDLHTFISTSDRHLELMRQASVVLDDVGRGGTSGDLVVGSSASGGFSEGIHHLDIDVRRDSSVQSISSTNNALQSISISNAQIAGTTAGDLSFSVADVRSIDGHSMQGSLNFTAAITAAALPKYLDPQHPFGTGYSYWGGAGKDSMKISVDIGAILTKAAAGTYDGAGIFLDVLGGAGDDYIALSIEGEPGWYARNDRSTRMEIDAGTGADTVSIGGSGDHMIRLGAGDDRLVFAPDGSGRSQIDAGDGNDYILLRAASGSTPSSSSDVISFLSQDDMFGNDVILNFSAGGASGIDQLDLPFLIKVPTFAGSAISHVHNSVTVQRETGSNDSAAHIAELYRPEIGAGSHAFIAYDTHNVGKVYHVREAAHNGTVDVKLVGTIDLGTTDWGSLGGLNFA